MQHGAAHRRLKRQIALVHYIAERYCSQEPVNLTAKSRPQIVGQALFSMGTAIDGIAGATGNPQRLIDALSTSPALRSFKKSCSR
jgi:hypothetical protein